MRFASAMSEHPVSAHAVGEVAGQILDRLGERPDLAVVFVTRPHAGALEDVAGAVSSILSPGALVGCAGESVLGTGREVEGAPAVSVWAARAGELRSFELAPAAGPAGRGTGSGWSAQGWPDPMGFEPRALVLLADPYSFPTTAFLGWLAERHPGLPVVGGMASAAAGPGGNRLAIGSRVITTGAVAVALGPPTEVSTVVSQGTRPVGRPLVVTGCEGNVLTGLAGEPALTRLLEIVERGLPERDVRLINEGGLHLGRVIDEHKAEFGRGDFLVRNVIGADRSSGAIAVGDEVEVGTTVQFHVRDAVAADEDLRGLLATRTAEAALLFTCNGRGTRLFGGRDHDAAVLAECVGAVPTAGFFAAGEVGPVGGRNFLHGFTASLALFD